MAFWINRFVYMSDGKCSPLPLWRLGRSLETLRTVEPLLNSLIRFGSRMPFERCVHSR